MRIIRTVVVLLLLVGLLLGRGTPAAAATGFDSVFEGQSAFVDIQPGMTATFQVFFMNTGTVIWGRGSRTQVDLAACLDDKITCDAQDASEATWSSGWLSPTRYATTTQVITAPGSIGTFTYAVKAPAEATGAHRFNGELVIDGTGERIHPEGYYQDATVVAAAASIYALTPNSGDDFGGTSIAIAGSGIVCVPAPTVLFGRTRGFVARCDPTTLSVFAPARPVGASGVAIVTVTNAGSTASNGLQYAYLDVTAPILIDARLTANVGDAHFADVGDAFTLTFSETMSTAMGIISPGLVCGSKVSCTWNAATTTLTVTVVVSLTTAAALQVPFTIVALDGFFDVQGNPADLARSFDRLVDIE